MGVENEEPLCDSRSERLGFTNEFGIDGSIRYIKASVACGLFRVSSSLAVKGEDFDYEQLTHMARKQNLSPRSLMWTILSSPLSEKTPIRFLRNARTPVKIPQIVRMETVRITRRSCLEISSGLENLRTQTQKSLNTLHIVGGGTQNELLNQMTLVAAGCEIIAGPIEASVGNILVQMIATGELTVHSPGGQGIGCNSFEPKIISRETLSSGRRHTLKMSY